MLDVLAELAAQVLEVNRDFFLRRVLPALTAAAERLNATVSDGTNGSPRSSRQDSATGT